jgi:serine/threonine protein kinase
VMEYVDGVSLQSLIKKSQEIGDPIPVPIACHAALNICRGLDYAHRKVGPDGRPLQIVHRDVSPQNILLSFEGEVKIVDFGIARAASRITSTQAGVVKGKVAYMSPEQLTGQAVDNRSDIFSVGIILYEMLTNRRPFEGGTPQETMAQISRGSFEKPQKLNKKVDKRLTAVLKKALERNPKKRYKTAGEMANQISDYLHRVGQHADAATLASFIPKRLPDARPRTIPPTPIRAIRRENDERNVASVLAPPSGPSVHVNEQELQSQPDHFPIPAAERSAAASFGAPAEEKPEPVVVNDGEAVSFGDLGLPPEYEPEDSRRPTDPERPKAKALSPKAGILEAETRLLPRSDESKPSEPEQVDPDLLSAATMLLTAQHEPAVPAHKKHEEKPAEPAPGEDEVESTWMQAGEKAAVAKALPVKEPAKPAAPEPPASDSAVMKAALGPRRTGLKALLVAGAVVVVLAIALFVILRPGDRSETEAPAPPPEKTSTTAAVSPEPAPLPTPPATTPEPEKAEPLPAPPEPKEEPALAPIEKPKAEKKPPKKIVTPPKRKKKKKPLPPKPPAFEPPERVAVTAPKPAPGKTGTLRINSEPFAVVYKGSQRLGPTPQMNIKLPAGSHTLTLKNDALGIEKRVRVRIEAGKVHTVFVELNK